MSNLKLEKQLCFKLYSLNKTLTKLYNPILKSLELTYPQYLVMMVLWESKKNCSIKEIGQALDLDTGTLSPLLKRMEALKLINRIRSAEDERTVYVSLTDKGNELKLKAEHIPEQMFSLTGLSQKQMISLQETLSNLMIATKSHL